MSEPQLVPDYISSTILSFHAVVESHAELIRTSRKMTRGGLG